MSTPLRQMQPGSSKVASSPAKAPSPSARLSPCCSSRTSPLPARSRSARRSLQVNAFLTQQNPFIRVGFGSNNSSKDVVSSRLLELRNRSDEADREFLRERAEAGDRRGSEEGAGDRPEGAGGKDDQPGTMALAGGGVVTPRSLRFMVADPKPEIKLLHRFKAGATDHAFWQGFVNKCRMAWGVFFPPAPGLKPRPRGISAWANKMGMLLKGSVPADSAKLVRGRSYKEVVMSRLQMVLIADRCGVSPEQLLGMKEQTLVALAEYMESTGAGAIDNDLQQLEVQVSALKPNGERVTMTIGFADMLSDEELRDPLSYHYEYEDPDDYFLPEEDDGRVAEIAEAPAAGLAAVRVSAETVSSAPAGAAQASAAE
ncbi:hypothetical protein HYH02_009021 [Chlamydomonas schloesseri]|uniref:Uncharacterized protein n=1 Tax=Chlamydomonas schloesseri TaxID=2026947 RepID=A0A835WB29_9CHLO|nr:hypothetical protein HYH02_009021 [Chlamydomonas schloesseri]|eukprot:KAG2444079.1 hypothetical protein HYH02_009021 [Chlamydomonas schloesseri]